MFIHFIYSSYAAILYSGYKIRKILPEIQASEGNSTPSPAGSLSQTPYTLPSVAPRWIHRIDQSSGYYFRQFAPCKVVARIIYYVFSMYCGYNSLAEIHDWKRNSGSTDTVQKVYIMHISRSCTLRNLQKLVRLYLRIE